MNTHSNQTYKEDTASVTLPDSRQSQKASLIDCGIKERAVKDDRLKQLEG